MEQGYGTGVWNRGMELQGVAHSYFDAWPASLPKRARRRGMEQGYGTGVWNKGMEQGYGTGARRGGDRGLFHRGGFADAPI